MDIISSNIFYFLLRKILLLKILIIKLFFYYLENLYKPAFCNKKFYSSNMFEKIKRKNKGLNQD
jgi:hypothetical protein